MARRTILSSFGCAIRHLTLRSEYSVAKSCRHNLLTRHTYQSITALRHCVVLAKSSASLEEVLKSRNVDDIHNSMDITRDVLVRGFLRSTDKEIVNTFFEGVEMEEVHTVESNKRPEKLFYVRFKDADSKTKGLSKHKEKYESRYIEVLDIKTNFQTLGLYMLADQSQFVVLKNISFDTKDEAIRTWVESFLLEVKNLVFLKRGECMVELGSSDQARKLFDHALDKLDGRPIYMRAFIPRDTLNDLRRKYASSDDSIPATKDQ